MQNYGHKRSIIKKVWWVYESKTEMSERNGYLIKLILTG